MKRRGSREAGCLVALLAAAACSGATPRPTIAQDSPAHRDRDRASFDRDWRFHKGEVAGGEQPGVDDSTWRSLDLPHDWAIEGPFDRRYNPQTGGLDVAGVGWYRKHFRLPSSERGRHYSIELDGAMAYARVFLNGRDLGTRPYGYIGFAFDLTPYLAFGETENVVAVRLAPEADASRWYPGAGIYRHVWLESTTDVHVARWGTFVTTPDVSEGRAHVVVRTELRNHRTTAARVTLQTTVLDADGRAVAEVQSDRLVLPQASEAADAGVDIPRPRRWDVQDPYLYSVRSVVREGERIVDDQTTTFGVRTIAFDKSKGFLLNGRPLKLHGVCMHHDLGALGTAVNAHAIERQLRTMKEMGANAVRTSHNPPAPELLDACDRLGLLVMDEAFDMWRTPKVPNGYSKLFDAWGEADLRDMIRRDRNHPSVILYSIGNEVPEQADPQGGHIAARLTQICHEEDGSRPVTSAFNQPDQAIRNGLASAVDIPGFNYQARGYERILRDHPDWIIVGSETASAVSSRGVYHLDLQKYEKHPSRQLTSYDIIAPPWAYEPDVEFDAQDRHPNILGEFVWTGFDYLGEPTPYFSGGPNDADWPARSSYFGIVDLAGFPKDRYFLYQSVWTDRPMVHVLPHWTWPGHEGQRIPVMVYTNGEEAELFVNGRSVGRQRRGSDLPVLPVGANVSEGRTYATRYRLLWQVPYEAGVLRAVAFTDGKEVAATEVRTAGPPARLRVSSDHTRLRADGEDLAFLTVRVEDKDGNLCPEAENLVRFQVEGPGRVAGVDNGNAATVEPFQASERRAFGGLCLVIVRPNRGELGRIRVASRADGLEGAETALTTE
jgi:beta-galactosidase